MIDTGAAPNVIKEKGLHPETVISHDDPLYLSGITSGRVKTLGLVKIHIMGHPVALHVVPNNFSIAQGDSRIRFPPRRIKYKSFRETCRMKRELNSLHGSRYPDNTRAVAIHLLSQSK